MGKESSVFSKNLQDSGEKQARNKVKYLGLSINMPRLNILLPNKTLRKWRFQQHFQLHFVKEDSSQSQRSIQPLLWQQDLKWWRPQLMALPLVTPVPAWRGGVPGGCGFLERVRLLRRDRYLLSPTSTRSRKQSKEGIATENNGWKRSLSHVIKRRKTAKGWAPSASFPLSGPLCLLLCPHLSRGCPDFLASLRGFSVS